MFKETAAKNKEEVCDGVIRHCDEKFGCICLVAVVVSCALSCACWSELSACACRISSRFTLHSLHSHPGIGTMARTVEIWKPISVLAAMGISLLEPEEEGGIEYELGIQVMFSNDQHCNLFRPSNVFIRLCKFRSRDSIESIKDKISSFWHPEKKKYNVVVRAKQPMGLPNPVSSETQDVICDAETPDASSSDTDGSITDAEAEDVGNAGDAILADIENF